MWCIISGFIYRLCFELNELLNLHKGTIAGVWNLKIIYLVILTLTVLCITQKGLTQMLILAQRQSCVLISTKHILICIGARVSKCIPIGNYYCGHTSASPSGERFRTWRWWQELNTSSRGRNMPNSGSASEKDMASGFPMLLPPKKVRCYNTYYIILKMYI